MDGEGVYRVTIYPTQNKTMAENIFKRNVKELSVLRPKYKMIYKSDIFIPNNAIWSFEGDPYLVMTKKVKELESPFNRATKDEIFSEKFVAVLNYAYNYKYYRS